MNLVVGTLADNAIKQYHALINCYRYNKNFPHAARLRHKPRVSRDQGYYEGDDDIDVQSIKSMPTRKSRHSNKQGGVQIRHNRPGGAKDMRPISHPSATMGEEQQHDLAQTMPAGYNLRRRRQTMPEFMLKDDVMKARESHQKLKERGEINLANVLLNNYALYVCTSRSKKAGGHAKAK